MGRLFARQPLLEALAVVDEHQSPLGMVHRVDLLNLLMSRYGRDLYGRKPILRHMETTPLCVEAHMPLEEVSRHVTERVRSHRDFIVTRQGRYLGIGRTRDLLRRITELQVHASRHANPLTLLPGNVVIQEHLDDLLVRNEPFVVCYCDLDHFKPFNDAYGYARGDQVIQCLAEILTRHCDPVADFVGHIGGDDFMLVLRSKDWEQRCRSILADFGTAIGQLYDPQDRSRGALEGHDRSGRSQFFPLLSLSIGAARVDPRRCRSHHDVSTLATQAKRGAKATPGNTLFLDRRRGPDGHSRADQC